MTRGPRDGAREAAVDSAAGDLRPSSRGQVAATVGPDAARLLEVCRITMSASQGEGEVRRLSVRDATNLYMHQGGIPMVIGWLAVFAPEPGATAPSFDMIRAAIEGRIARVARLRQRILPLPLGLGRPIWVDDASFDLDQHVRALPLPPGETSVSALLEHVEEVFARPVDLRRPPWDLHVLTDDAGRAVAVVQRIHHALADGAASAAIAAALMDHGADPVPAVWRPRAVPSRRRLLVDNLRRWAAVVTAALARLRAPLRLLRRTRDLVRELRVMSASQRAAPATSLTRSVGPDRRLAVLHAPLAAVRAAGRRHGGTVNDVLLAAAGGGLRALLAARGEPVDDLQLHVAVPVSIRHTSDAEGLGNRTSSMIVPLHVDEPDVARRLEKIAVDTRRLKAERARLALNGLMDSAFVPPVMHRNAERFTRNQRLVHLFLSNVPGPDEPLAMAGTTIGDVVPVVPLTGNVPIAIGAISYAGTITLGIRHCPDRVPDIDRCTRAVADAVEELAATTAAAGGSAVRERNSPGAGRPSR